MWLKGKRAVNVNNLKGFTLIEILISLSLSIIILLAITGLYQDIYRTNQAYQEQLRLQKNAHQLIDYLKSHLLNAGYQGIGTENSNFSLFKINNKSYLVEKNCLILLEDINSDGCLGTPSAKKCLDGEISRAREVNKEIIAIKAENKQLWVLGKNERFNLCSATECQRPLRACSQIKWDKVTDNADSLIERLEFQWDKPDELLKITLELRSIQHPQIYYQIIAYSYLLNGKEE